MAMAMKMAAVSMEMTPGAIPHPGGVTEQRFCPPKLVFTMAAATELFVEYRRLF
jgi:hypothetical protein